MTDTHRYVAASVPNTLENRKEDGKLFVCLFVTVTGIPLSPQQRGVHLVYFWMPISLGMDSGRMMMRHMMKRANRWSVYQ